MFGLVWFYGISTIVGHLMPKSGRLLESAEISKTNHIKQRLGFY